MIRLNRLDLHEEFPVKSVRCWSRFVVASGLICLGVWIGWPLPAASESQHQTSKAASPRLERSPKLPNGRETLQPDATSRKQSPRMVKTPPPAESAQPEVRTNGRDKSKERRKSQAGTKDAVMAGQPQRPIAQDLTYRLDRDYPGMLQRPERAVPRLDRNHDGQVDPWEQMIAQERFAQLDRNRDGIVDPMERALDFVDMDHYGRNGPLQSEPRLVRSQTTNTVVPVDQPVTLKPSRSKSHLKKSVPHVDLPAKASQTPSTSTRRQVRIAPRKESSAR